MKNENVINLELKYNFSHLPGKTGVPESPAKGLENFKGFSGCWESGVVGIREVGGREVEEAKGCWRAAWEGAGKIA